MFKQLKLAIGLAITATLVACGGGGDSAPAPPVTSTDTFAFKTAYVNLITTSQTKAFKVSGTVAGIAVTGSGTATFGNLSSATFEGKTALSRSYTATGTASANGQTIPVNVTSTLYYDSNYNPLGTASNEYAVINSTPPSIPQTAKVGDTGVLYTFIRYATRSKTDLRGTNTVSYVIEPDTATTALVTIIETAKDNTGKVIASASLVFRATPTGSITLVKETATDFTFDIILNLTYD
jgi:hypothetical protein